MEDCKAEASSMFLNRIISDMQFIVNERMDGIDEKIKAYRTTVRHWFFWKKEITFHEEINRGRSQIESRFPWSKRREYEHAKRKGIISDEEYDLVVHKLTLDDVYRAVGNLPDVCETVWIDPHTANQLAHIQAFVKKYKNGKS